MKLRINVYGYTTKWTDCMRFVAEELGLEFTEIIDADFHEELYEISGIEENVEFFRKLIEKTDGATIVEIER